MSSSIVEVQDLASRLQQQHKKVAPLSQDFTEVSARLKPCLERQRIHSTIDPLTATNNRSDLDHLLKLVSEQAHSCTVPLSYLAFAEHGLRPIKAFHGRQKGDDRLPPLITNVKQLLHANDALFGIGSSECLVLL